MSPAGHAGASVATSAIPDIVGHMRARGLLAAAAREGAPAHAYLILGPTAVGKRTLARAFARALNCQATPDQRPCGGCRSCRLFDAGSHPDVRVVDRRDPSSWGDDRRGRGPRNVPIEAIRALQHDAALTSHLGGHKVYVIVEAEWLSFPAMDALLKTLEEPARGVVMILTCVDPFPLPLTIASRCQSIKLGLVAPGEIAAELVARRGLAPERAEIIAHLAAGRPGRAFALAADTDALATRDAELAEIVALELASRADRLKYAERLAQDHGKDAEATRRRLELMLVWWRDLLLVHAGCDELVVNRDQLPMLRGRAARLSLEQIDGAIRTINLMEQYLGENVQPRLALEHLALALPRA